MWLFGAFSFRHWLFGLLAVICVLLAAVLFAGNAATVVLLLVSVVLLVAVLLLVTDLLLGIVLLAVVLLIALLVVLGFASFALVALVVATSALVLLVPAPVLAALVVMAASVTASAVAVAKAGGVAGTCGHNGSAGERTGHDVGMVFYDGDGLGYELLNIAKKFFFFFVAEGQCCAVGACSAGTAYAMDVGFRNVGELEVDDVGQLVDIDAAGGDIRCDEYPCLSAFKVEECALAGVLRLIAVDRFGADAGSYQSLGDFIGAVLGARKYEGRRDGGSFQDVEQQGFFVLLFDEIDGLLYRLGGGGHGGHFHSGWIDKDGVCQSLYLRGHGRGEEQRMSFGRQLCEHLADVMDEAHVEHPVCFVEDEVFDIAEADELLVDEVKQTAGGCYQYIGAALETVYLWLLGYAAEDDQVLYAGISAVGGKGVGDLYGKFTGWGKHQRADGAVSSVLGFGGDAGCVFAQQLKNGKGECCGLPGSCLGAAQQVFSFE